MLVRLLSASRTATISVDDAEERADGKHEEKSDATGMPHADDDQRAQHAAQHPSVPAVKLNTREDGEHHYR